MVIRFCVPPWFVYQNKTYPPPVSDGPPPMQRFCPRGEVSASADEGGIPVRAFLPNDWLNTFTPLTTSWSPPPMGENFILNPVRRFSPTGGVRRQPEGGILPPIGGVRPQDGRGVKKTADAVFFRISRCALRVGPASVRPLRTSISARPNQTDPRGARSWTGRCGRSRPRNSTRTRTLSRTRS